MNDIYVIEIAVKAGEKGELYETGKHKVEQQCVITKIYRGYYMAAWRYEISL